MKRGFKILFLRGDLRSFLPFIVKTLLPYVIVFAPCRRSGGIFRVDLFLDSPPCPLELCDYPF